MIEVVCPNCGIPRARDAKQCVRNYTFEYDKIAPARPRSGAGAGSAALGPFIGILAALAGGFTAVLLSSSVAREARPRPELGLLLIAFGIFAVCGGIFDWEFFMSNRKARRFVFLLGRTGARFFYGVLGGGLAGAGVWMALL